MLLKELLHKEAIVAGPIPKDIMKKINQLLPGAKTAGKTVASLLQNPVVAKLVAVPLSKMTGTPISPQQVMMGAHANKMKKLLKSAKKEMRKVQKKLEARNYYGRGW
jgi:predicted ATP-grasp superfamily ATP-dependent carboligase